MRPSTFLAPARPDRRLNAEAVQAKQRLIRFLHEEMGFDVLAYEAAAFDGEEMDRSLDGSAASSIYLKWVNSHLKQAPDPVTYHGLSFPSSVFQHLEPGTVVPSEVFDYARATRKTGRPLHVSGFGSQISGFMQWEYAKRLFQLIDRLDPRLAPSGDRKAIKSMLNWVQLATAGVYGGTRGYPTPKQRTQWQAAIANLYDNLGRLPADGPDAREIAFFRTTLANLAWDNSHLQFASRVNDAREREVDNLIWLAKEWQPGRQGRRLVG